MSDALKPRRFVRMFKPRFAALVESGRKTQTVRPVPKRMPRVGDIFDGRMWAGVPYRSRQVFLRSGFITRVEDIALERWEPGQVEVVLGERLNAAQREAFARADGFVDAEEMGRWFEETHGLPFRGILIEWDPRDEVDRTVDRLKAEGLWPQEGGAA